LATSKSPPWFLVPCLAMLTYGWVFYMGFFNFYLAAGLSLWALALSLRRRAIWRVATVALLAAAYSGNPIAPAWATCVIFYTWAARRLARRLRFLLFTLSCCGIAVLRFWITTRYHAFSSFHQVLESGGIDQVWVFGSKYWMISIVLALLWGFLLLRISHIKGFAGAACDISLQLCLLTAVGILLLPSSVELPQYRIAVSFITERMTLLYGVLICAFLAAANPPKWLGFAFVPLAILYFSLLFVDTDALNRVERRMETLTSVLSPNDRVFSSFEDPYSRVQLWGHNLDRVCLGRCLSYANYEPFTQQFRIRAIRDNPLVVANPLDYGALQAGGYVVKQSDLPFYQITFCAGQPNQLCLNRLSACEITRHDLLTVTPALW